MSLQSATKFIGGHSDLLAGVVTTKDAALWHTLRRSRELNGATPGTLEAFLATRGARTLALRLQRARLSVGIEDVDDLWADLFSALRSSAP